MRILALIKRIFQEMFRDKRTLALLFVAPLLILSLMYLLFNGETPVPRLGISGVNEEIGKLFEEQDLVVITYSEIVDKNTTIINDDLDALLLFNNNQYELILENSYPATSKQLQMKVNQVIAGELQNKILEQINLPIEKSEISMDLSYVYGDEATEFFDILSPILIGFFVFFFVFLISGIGLLKERTSGTLERLLSTPIKRYEIVVSYLVGFGIFAVIQTLIVVFYSIHVLDIVLVGSIWNVIFINLMLALVALSLGILLSAFAASEFQMVQFIPIAVIPQIFFSGIIPIEGMADWLQVIAKLMPIYYAADGLNAVMYKGQGISDILGTIVTLAIFAAIFITLNILALKRYRRL